MQSVQNIFMMAQEDPISSHINKYTMHMNPSDHSTSKNKKYDKYNCFIICKAMKKTNCILKITMIWESGSVCKAKTETDAQGTFGYTYEFKRPMVLKRYPDIVQNLVFEVWDYEENIILGKARFAFTTAHTDKDFFVTIPILSNTKEDIGRLQAFFSKCEKISRDFVGLEFIGKDLLNVDGFGDKSDPFLVFHRLCNDDMYIPVHSTAAVFDNLNPKWEKIITSIDELCRGDYNNAIKIECWDWEEDYRYQFIGETVTTLNKLFTKPTLALTGYENKKTGELIVKYASKLLKPSPTDFFSTQDSFAFVLGIDFSLYNRKPFNTRDLHGLDRKNSTMYLKALEQISKLMWSQDTDGKIPCFGFGGKPSFPDFNTEDAHSLIPLSGNNHKMSIQKPELLVEAYKNCLKYITPSSPASIMELLKLIQTWALRDIKSNLYYVLVILTAGHLDDLQKTIDLLIEMGQLPVSVVLVGIGDSDFGTLEKLDGDKRWLRNSNKKLAARDIVNFVDFGECCGDNEKFGKKLLEEFPEQFMAFKLMTGYKPKV